MEAKLIKTDGSIISIEPKNKKHFEYKEVLDILKCDIIQTVGVKDEKMIMICDEEGKLKNNPIVNEKATDIYMEDRMTEEEFKEIYGSMYEVIILSSPDGLSNKIVGDVILCPEKMFL